jgi:hypothetical protein
VGGGHGGRHGVRRERREQPVGRGEFEVGGVRREVDVGRGVLALGLQPFAQLRVPTGGESHSDAGLGAEPVEHLLDPVMTTQVHGDLTRRAAGAVPGWPPRATGGEDCPDRHDGRTRPQESLRFHVRDT